MIEDRHPRPGGNEPDDAIELEGVKPASELAKDPVLWQVSIGFGLVMTSPVVILSLLIDFGQSTLGFSGQQATLFFLAAAPLSLVGKLPKGGLVVQEEWKLFEHDNGRTYEIQLTTYAGAQREFSKGIRAFWKSIRIRQD